ncbi:MAG: SUF system FeS assembly protein, NifU family [Candidatus Curtissbacteria bacterium GW2011_GWA2_41_24]|uniref:SUF system FeS assembly protein, NifU family n=1 Tax=Candidatus Curtissbacteria bacterium GW2011_GWA2_41_24 TaxID=1618411 RepID=A0A0G0Y483_9BACT|nr:MAG: SUF system FeS assembly protein, NifU family [Candidatus Curtissbacteria bacterium GW2011_GWA2_41_24]
MTDIYREEILEHWQNPLNFGEMPDADLVIDQINPLCGDEVRFYFKIKNNKVAGVSFVGNGCAISIASAFCRLKQLKNWRLVKTSILPLEFN